MSTRLLTTPCMDVKIGGTVSGSTITGGRSIVSEDLLIVDYTALWGAPGGSAGASTILGQPGAVVPGYNLPRPRLHTLNMAATDTNSATGVPSNQDLVDNTDDLTALFDDPTGTIIEWVMPDLTSRWVRAYQFTSVPVSVTRKLRRMALLLTSPWPYWRAETVSSQVVNGAAVASTVGGTVKRIYDPTLLFSSNGSFTDNSSGLAVVVAGAAAPVTVSRDIITGRWGATESGSPVPNKVTVTDPRWIYLTSGGTYTTTVSVTVSWRDQWV